MQTADPINAREVRRRAESDGSSSFNRSNRFKRFKRFERFERLERLEPLPVYGSMRKIATCPDFSWTSLNVEPSNLL